MSPGISPGISPGLALRRTGAFAARARVVRSLRLTPIRGTWLLARGREKFVLHVDGPAAARLGLDRRREFRLQALAASAGVAAEPVLLRAAAPAVLVTRYVPGTDWSAGVPPSAAELDRLIDRLGALQSVRLPGSLQADDLPVCIARYAALADSPAAARLARDARVLHARIQADGEPAVLCHRDLLPANIVGRRALRLIDWEYAGAGHPGLDVATLGPALPVAARRRLDSALLSSGRASAETLRALRRLSATVSRLWTLAAVAAERGGAGEYSQFNGL